MTPFAARALDRGFVGALVTMARHSDSAMTPPAGEEKIAGERAELERRLLDTFMSRLRDQPAIEPEELEDRLRSVQNSVVDLLDSWLHVYADYEADGVRFQYQKYETKGPKPLLSEMLDTEFENEHQRKFRVNRSLRDVEPQVNLFMKDYHKAPEVQS